MNAGVLLIIVGLAVALFLGAGGIGAIICLIGVVLVAAAILSNR